MLPHVELNRTFWRLVDTEEDDAEALRTRAAFGLEGEDWSILLERSRVIILAEAGTGKTHELREKARRLRKEGKSAFLFRLEDLAALPLADALEEANIAEFDSWLGGDEFGFFFLDSVDEARLKDSRYFEWALRALARGLGDQATRARIFITARVSDWRATGDLSLVAKWLPPPIVDDSATEEKPPRRGQPTANDVVVVQLAPLASDQMRQFAIAQGVQDAQAFMDAIAQADAEIFAERPQDLLELLAYWSKHRAIASHAELIDFNVRAKLAEPNPDRDVARPIASATALEGAMSLAAALTLTRRSSIVLPDQPVDPIRAAASIGAKDVLPDWNAKDLQILLSRPLFDEATYGRVRIHHRSVQEYLTARWLRRLLERGKPRRAIEGLLFATCYGIQVGVPSMRPVAAWLALWDDRICERIIAIAPEVLLEQGDPSCLAVNVRSRLLRAFADLNQGRSNTDLSFDLASIRRLAHPQLAATVLQLLEQHRANRDLREALLGTIWQGQLTDCATAALSFALDSSLDPYTRILGIRAVAAAGDDVLKRGLANALLANSGEWSNRELGEAVDVLFPETLTLEELLGILEHAEPPHDYSVDPLDQALEKIASKMPLSEQESFLAALVNLLEREPHIARRDCSISVRYSWLLVHAAKLAEQIIVGSDGDQTRFLCSVLRTIVLVAEGKHYITRHHDLGDNLKCLIDSHPRLRSQSFWHAVEYRCKQMKAKDERLTEWWQIGFIYEFVRLKPEDLKTLLTDIRRRDHPDDRIVALTAAFVVWQNAGRPRKGRDCMWRVVRGEPKLEKKLRTLLHPGPASTETKRWRQRGRDRARREAKRLQQEEQARLQLSTRLAGKVDDIRRIDEQTKDQLFPDLFWLARRIMELAEATTRWGSDRWDLLENDLGTSVAEAARDGLMRSWRLYEPPLNSENGSTGTTNGVLAGLVGLAIEARERPSWTRRLSEDEARIAARYAIHEMNGMPDWAPDLMEAHPEAFDAALIPELRWELSLSSEVPVPDHLLSSLRSGHEAALQRYRPFIQRLLEEHEPGHAHTLESALCILLQWNALDRSRLAALARGRYEASKDDGRRLTWLAVQMYVDAAGAVRALRAWLDDADDPMEADRRMIGFCNALMSHHELRFGTVWRDFDRLEMLRELVPLVYRHVRMEDDNVHRGAYSPNARDNAETTRGYLLSRVAQTPGREAFGTLTAFSQELSDQWSRDRMVVLARRRAADDAQREAWSASDVSTFAREAETEPRSGRDLFELTCNRVDDLKLELEGGDASEAVTLGRSDQETEVRNWFANRLRQASRGRYSVPPEEELADATRPDLRIHASAIDSPVSIELKIADNWSYSQLAERLRNQLIGQYLRDVRSKFAIFLLVWRGKKQAWKDSKSGQLLSFSQLVERLQCEAGGILRNRPDLDGISVVGINLTQRHTPVNPYAKSHPEDGRKEFTAPARSRGRSARPS